MDKSIGKTSLKQVLHLTLTIIIWIQVMSLLMTRQIPQRSCCSWLLVWRVDNHTSMACQEPWFKPDRAHLGHYRSPSEQMNTAGSNLKWLGANTAPGMTASYSSLNSSFSGQYEKTISGSHPCEWKLKLITNFFRLIWHFKAQWLCPSTNCV